MLGLFAMVPSVVESFVIIGCLEHYPCLCCSLQSSLLYSKSGAVQEPVAGVTLFSELSTLLQCYLFRCDSTEREPGGQTAQSACRCYYAMVEKLRIRAK